MPKIVDHSQQRREIAEKATLLFSRYGYSGLGMRRIAEELGMSKSALYHYFPTKQALFLACTQVATEIELPEHISSGSEPDDPIQPIQALINAVEPGFENELALLLDYLRGKSNAEKAEDPAMQLSNRRFLEMIETWLGPDDARPVLCMVYGLLMMRYFDGQQTSIDDVLQWLRGHLAGG